MWQLISFNTLGDKSLTPGDLSSLSRSNLDFTSSSLILMSSSRPVSAPVKTFLGTGILTASSAVKTDENCSLKTSAMAPASLTCHPQLSRSGPACTLLLVLLVAYAKKGFLSSFIFRANLPSGFLNRGADNC